ncbi:MAG: hypothetical protein MJE77_30350, partial [Proteobacteria bacterium]|nr:hypothetical protein [Pseudomonadota bacterium]
MTDLEKLLCEGPRESGQFTSWDGKRTVEYTIRLLSPGELEALKITRAKYLAAEGVIDCTPATADIWDQELKARILAKAVLDPETDKPLAPLETWRHTQGRHIEHCLRHYTKLEALEQPTDMELGA